MIFDDPGDSVRLVLPFADRRVARALRPADFFWRLVHLEHVIGVLLTLLDLLVRQLAGADRVAARQLRRRRVVGDRLHFKDVEAAEFGDLLEAERGVVDQPGSGRMGHERLSHEILRQK